MNTTFMHCGSVSMGGFPPAQTIKVSFLLPSVSDIRSRIAGEPSGKPPVPIQPVFLVQIAFVVASALREFGGNALYCALCVFLMLEVQTQLGTTDEAARRSSREGPRSLEYGTHHTQDYGCGEGPPQISSHMTTISNFTCSWGGFPQSPSNPGIPRLVPG